MHIADTTEAGRSGNAANLFDETARCHGESLAIEAGGDRTSHAELRGATGAFAGGLHDLGLAPDDTLLLYLPNCPQYLVAALGAFRAGVVVSPANPQYKARELSYQLDDANVDAVVTHAALREHLVGGIEQADADPVVITVGAGDGDRSGDEEATETDGANALPSDEVAFEAVRGDPVTVDREDDDVALLPYTSGTTGKPKGVRLTHRNFRAQLLTTLANHGEIPGEEVRSLLYLPLYHITGFTHTAMQPLVGGGALYLRNPTDWDADEAMATVEEAGITHFVGVTAMYVDMVDAESFGDHDLSSLVQAAEGGAKMSVAVQREFEATAGIEMTEGYGLTETNGATHSQQRSTFGPRHGTIGQPLRMVDCRIVDEGGEEVSIGESGELLVRGPQVMAGYHGMPEATDAAFTEAGFFRTGDVARRDPDNYFEIVDRKKHVIVTAGYNVYPSEVEELLHEHDAVAEAAVVGVPDERRNEVPKAFVVVKSGVEAGVDVTSEELTRYCLERVAEYKHPRAVEFIDDLPRTASGKIQKFRLADGEYAED
ncbi:class I adenylate-forming enzyme family protein [Halomarina oriensis]|uniref:AMP-binding protein n=1 Tax=Halomarina oriensis TaxID=671145 RepID=A0A6B0GNA4_9EURY|nr:class I adenylate-forming enzyme family protein [Halomarina oriensis]MWG36352.1 AMP-binding protein [Halomarina oriensis]